MHLATPWQEWLLAWKGQWLEAKASQGAGAEDGEAFSSHRPALLWDITGRGGRRGEATAVKHLTGYLVLRLKSPPQLGEQLHPLLRMTTLLQPDAPDFHLLPAAENFLYFFCSQKTR